MGEKEEREERRDRNNSDRTKGKENGRGKRLGTEEQEQRRKQRLDSTNRGITVVGRGHVATDKRSRLANSSILVHRKTNRKQEKGKQKEKEKEKLEEKKKEKETEKTRDGRARTKE